MSKAHKDKLQIHFHDLISNMSVDELVSRMVAGQVFTLHEAQKIRAKPDDEERAFKFLDIIRKKSEAAYYHLVEALRETGQPHLANLLQRRGE